MFNIQHNILSNLIDATEDKKFVEYLLDNIQDFTYEMLAVQFYNAIHKEYYK